MAELRTDYIHIGFTGTRKGMTQSQLNRVDDFLDNMDDVGSGSYRWAHHGDCIGADAEFHVLAKESGYRVYGHPPIKDDLRAFCDFDIAMLPYPYLKRNRDIVDNSDVLIVVPEQTEEQPKGGTWSTYRYAKKLGRDIYLVLP